MANPDKPNYSHGSTGTEPTNSIDYTNGDPVESENFDYFIGTLFEKIKAIIDRLNTIDSDGDGQVDAADTADDATNVTGTYKSNDIDSDGDGKVDAADSADTATDASNVTGTYKGNDLDTNGDGQVDAADTADDATNVTGTYKGNDIDSNGDGKVDAAETADDADTVDGFEATEFFTNSTTDDLSDVTVHTLDGVISDTLVDVQGSGQLIACHAQFESDNAPELTVTIDGGATQTITPVEGGASSSTFVELPPISFENSLTITIDSGANTADCGGYAWTK